MKHHKTLSVFITLSIIAVAAVITINHTTSSERELLKANIEALANDPNNPQNLIEDGEGGGNFPLCVTKNGTGDLSKRKYCVDGVCTPNVWVKDGYKLENYCN